MTERGKKIQEYLEDFQNEVSIGCEELGHTYTQNGTISCVKCGKTKL